jgi:hypothetical protein
MRDGEFLGVDAVRASRFEHLHAPVDGALHGGRAGHAAADLVGQVAQIAFERRGLEGFLDDLVGVVVQVSGGCGRETGEA